MNRIPGIHDEYWHEPAAQAERKGTDGYGVAALFLGVAGLLLILPVIGSLLAVWFAGISERTYGPNKAARMGRRLGWIALSILGALLALAIMAWSLRFGAGG